MNYTKHFKNSKLSLIFTMILMLSGAFLYAEEPLSDFDNDALLMISNFRWKLDVSESCDAAVKAIEEKEEWLHSQEICDQLNPEVYLSIENILVWEKYNYIYEDRIDSPLLEPLIKAQYEKVKAFFKAHKKEHHSKWLYTTSGDILSCCMQFLPLATAMNEGLTIKKYYDSGLNEDEDFMWCLINIAQWYFYAPIVNGGGKGKAMRTFEHAVYSSLNDAELFHAKLLLSQSLFEDGNLAACEALLQECEDLQPGSRKVAFYKKINKIGHSYFDYTVNRKKVDKKLKKQEM